MHNFNIEADTFIKCLYNLQSACLVVKPFKKLTISGLRYISGVRFCGRPVANGAKKWLRATSVFDYSGPHGYWKYLRSCNILDPAKINGMLINISEVLSWLYRISVNHKSCVCDTFDIARNVARP